MKQKRISFITKLLVIVLLSTPVVSFMIWNNEAGGYSDTHDTYQSLEIFSDVLSIIEKNYVDDIDTKEVIEGAIKGMLVSLDPHSSYMNPDAFKELKVETKGSFTGIGIEITTKNGILTVVSPIEGTPAFKKGLKAGDKIMKIEDETTTDMTLMEAVKRLRGPKGTKITISIHREGWSELKEVTLVRDIIPIQSVKSRTLEPGYGYIRIINFQSKTTTDFTKHLKELGKDQELLGLIVDLRNNPGGLLDQAVKIADIFIDEGLIVSTKGRIKDQNMVFKAHSGGTVHDFPVVVLVNEGSASASEIVAGALQDHKKAVILGAQTFGKGSVQTIIPMRNGAGLRLTTAKYYTPNGRSIQATGITPDIEVATEVIAKGKQEAKKNNHRFLREKDLKRHIKNPNESEQEDESQIEENGADNDVSPENMDEPETDDDTKEVSEKELIERDPQLRAALMLLKGLNVFGAKK